jgi:LacI family transcriptional regulator
MNLGFNGENPNPHRVTIVDVAHLAGVSVASASKVVRGTSGVSEEMRVKVNNAVAKLGYRPHRMAQGLRGPLKTIGVLLSGIDSPFFATLMNGAAEVLAQSGYEIFISPAGLTAESHYTAMESLIDHRMGGLLLVAPLGATSRLEGIASQIPTVVIGRHGENARYDTIAGDDALGTQLVVQHLVDSGHRRITFFASQNDDASDLPQHVRLQGYRTAMAAHGLHSAIDVVLTEWSFEGGVAASERLLSRDQLPDAVIAGPDVTALGFLGEAWARGIRTPDDLAVVGYDNIPMSAWPPIALTSVDQSGFEMGRIAAQMLLERIEGRAEFRHETLPVSLVPRRTSGG